MPLSSKAGFGFISEGSRLRVSVARSLVGRLSLVIFFIHLSGCSQVFFLPGKEEMLTPKQLGLAYEDVTLSTPDGYSLHGWLLHAQGKLCGSVYFLHGNAENISTHIASVMWLPAHGYQVFLLDYRGYGRSTGSPDIAGALQDIETGYQWLLARPESEEKPVFLLGQSLGAALLVAFGAAIPDLHERVDGVIVDAAFTRYRGIAREKLGSFWLTWPFQYPLSWLLPGSYDPIDYIAQLSPTPLLLIHSKEDEIIPYHHGEELFAAARSPKFFLSTDTRHIGTFNVREYRHALLHFLDAPLESTGVSETASVPSSQCSG
ncbi:alpha/beta hydrolase [Nitrosococcus watsonii]|uniref:Alpha/beta hydrolase fold protein n=1 Tax=Nitrosococcus watsoni (strain C-113) TaxID=105559 RepID=D8K4E1_NITWC|nr:alpha/beta hydrolase [Nitrosococcus watsonii]ADJ27838.1 alpha/beta hydrolase fold protein [Nitrosococcus watsonii C-113]